MGVPRSTCWKAQLRPIYINTTRSSSTSPSIQRAQDPRGWVSREEVQDQPDEGFTEHLVEHHRLSKDAAQASSPRNHHQERGRRGSLTSKRPSTTRRTPRVKDQASITCSSLGYAPRVDPTLPLWGHDRLLVLQYSTGVLLAEHVCGNPSLTPFVRRRTSAPYKRRPLAPFSRLATPG